MESKFKKNSKIFRKCSLGETLKESIKILNKKTNLSEELNDIIMSDFDKVMANSLKQNAKISFVDSFGKLKTYRRCDDEWYLVLENAEFVTEGGEIVKSDRLELFGSK